MGGGGDGGGGGRTVIHPLDTFLDDAVAGSKDVGLEHKLVTSYSPR